MPAKSAKFTDHQLKILFGQLLKHYEKCTTAKYSINQTYDEMYFGIQYALQCPLGSLYYLDQTEKDKVYSAFNTIFYSLPLYGEEKQKFNPKRPNYTEENNHIHVTIYKSYYAYRSNDSLIFNWLLLNELTHHCHHRHGNVFGGGNNRYHENGNNRNGGRNNHSKDDSKAMMRLLLIALALAAVVLAFIALAYMLNQSLESADRFYYNEGWLKAALVLANSVAFGAGTCVLTLAFGAAPLASLAIMAGFNPAGVIVIGAILLTIIGAGVGSLAASLLHDFINPRLNKDAMDPTDPLRFRLTAKEEENLIAKGIDPVAVKCAMIAIRAEIGKELNSKDGSIPSFLMRKFGKGERVQPWLDRVRELRQGELKIVHVGHFAFNCEDPSMCLKREDRPEENPDFIGGGYYPNPSAPPL